MVPSSPRDRRAPWLWLALVVPLWAALALCVHWEPILHDGWGPYFRHHEWSGAPHGFATFVEQSVTLRNPRFGQLASYVAYGPLWHAIVTPLVELALLLEVTVLALGRWPSPRSTGDALVFATVTAIVLLATPQIGAMLFYRPYTYNYVVGLAVQLAVALPYRRHVEAPRARGWWWTPLMLAGGAVAGFCNEHTGPTLAALIALAIVAVWRRDHKISAWMIAGLVGVIAGGLLLFFAPGQDTRYGGLATQDTLLGRIAARGALRDLGVALSGFGYAYRMLPWLALAAIAAFWRRGGPPAPFRVRVALVLALAPLAIGLTLLVSPKVGARLQLASLCLLAAAVALALGPQLAERARLRLVAWILALAAIGYVLASCVATYAIVGPEFADRLAALERAPKQQTLVLAPYSVPPSRWFIGDDLLAPAFRRWIGSNFGLAGVELDRAAPPDAAPPDL